MSAIEQSEFPFEEGDEVLVRVREGGKIIAKFQATCTGITDESGIGKSQQARFDMPFGVMNSVTIRPYEGEFEVVE